MDSKKKIANAKTGAEITASLVLGPAGAMTAKILGAVVVPIIEHVTERRTRRASQFIESFLESGYPTESAHALLESEIARAPAETKDAVFDALRALDETLSDNVVPVLALLARTYVRAGTPKDRFFIGMLRVLRDLSETEFSALKALISTVDTLWREPRSEICIVSKMVHGPNAYICIDPGYSAPWNSTYDQLFQALSQVGFSEIATDAAGFKSAQAQWRLMRVNWARMFSLLREPNLPTDPKQRPEI